MKRMLGVVMAAALAVSLSGCSVVDWWVEHIAQPIASTYGSAKVLIQTDILNPFNDRTVASLGLTLSTAIKVLDVYAHLKPCPADTPAKFGAIGPDGALCHVPSLLKTWRALAGVAETAEREVFDLQKTHPQGSVLIGGPLAQKFTQAQQAIAAVTNLAKAYAAAANGGK